MPLTEGLTLPLPATRAVSETDVTALVGLYSPLLFRVAHAVLRHRAEAEDAVQDTFVRVLEHRADLAGVRDMRVWLVRICWRLALDRRRRIRPQQMDEEFAASLACGDVPADQALDQRQEMRRLLDELERLPAAERQALLLSTMDELSAVEVAGIMQRSESAVRALVFRARQRLRTRMEKGVRR